MATDFTTWLAAFLTLGIISMVIFKDNPLYNLIVSAYMGIGVGHGVIMGLRVIFNSGVQPMFQESQFALIIPLLFGILLFARYFDRYARLARPSAALIVAVAAGLGLRGSIVAQFLDQIKATFIPLNSVGNIVLIVSVITTIIYFLFTERYTDKLVGPLSHLPTLGRWAMMICFGASFASASAGFLSKLIVRFMFLVRDWLGLIS